MHAKLKKSLLVAAVGLLAWSTSASAQADKGNRQRPTIVLVHGAFADSSSWNGVITGLVSDGYPVLAAANPLRSVDGDAAYLSSILKSIKGDVVLVGHSYGGIVISVAGSRAPNVKSLVFVAGYAPDVGESAIAISKRFPEGTLGQALAPAVVQADGSKDLYIDSGKFWKQFAADVPQSAAIQMAAAQRPIIEAALSETASAAAWRSKPSWFIYGSLDKNIPQSAHAFMAKRANARQDRNIAGASHVVMISHSQEVAAVIREAAD